MAGTEKKPILRWRGLMADVDRNIRIFALVACFCASIALAFTQLGFVRLSVPGTDPVYAVLLLPIIALAALLLGTLDGTLVGLVAGVALFVHAHVMPLDVYEVLFVNGVSSVVYLTITGFMLGVLFAFALRNSPSTVRRFVYIAIICTFAAWAYTVGFAVNAVAVTVTESLVNNDLLNTTEEQLSAILSSQIARLDVRYGSLDLQAWTDAVLMAGACILGDVLARRASQSLGNMGMRTLFNASLTFVVLNVFMLMSVFTFAVISHNERLTAFDRMQGNVDYLCMQINATDRKLESLEKFFDTQGFDPNDASLEDYQYYSEGIAIWSLMEGYSLEADGIVFESSGPLILMSNVGENLRIPSAGLDEDVQRALETSVESGEICPLVFDGSIVAPDEEGGASDARSEAELAYICGKATESGFWVGNIMTTNLIYADRTGVMISTTLSTLMLLLAVSGLVFTLLNRMVLRRIDETNGVLGRITGGDLDARVEVHDSREFNSLSAGINATVDAMKGWIAEAETRMDAELETARAIQESALPRTFPPFPDILRFDVHASMVPARQVGGDFYDFFLIGEDSGPDSGRLGFVVADVSGKGVPAALFMMEAKSQIRGYVSSGMELGEAVENANRQLCDGNDAGMFVTAWVGVLDYATGRIDYVNAGHNPPLLWSFAGGGGAPAGSWRWLTERSGLPLGLFDGLPYEAHALECLPGDQLLMYSDGVTEAMDPDGNLYGEERLMALAEEHYLMHPRELLGAVRKDVSVHAAGAEQSDDITILVLEVGVPPEASSTLDVPADILRIHEVNAFLHDELDKRLCPKRVQNLLDIAVEELFVNVCRYAYKDAPEGVPRMVHVRRTYSAEPPCIVVELIDEGVPYNPLAKPDAVTPDDIMDVPIGGLGILMAKRSVDEMRYERADGSNVVTIVKKW